MRFRPSDISRNVAMTPQGTPKIDSRYYTLRIYTIEKAEISRRHGLAT